ncbi:hypothetical protein PINS_up013579 [Pythium insidiosum]|nr:hypothetical protein PINS_up013579 [Pythium insidiosum]
MRRRHLSLRKMLTASPSSSSSSSSSVARNVTESMRRFLGLQDEDSGDFNTNANNSKSNTKVPTDEDAGNALLSTEWQQELARFRVDATALERTELLASGQFGHVWRATLRPHGTVVAVKSLKDPRRVTNEVVERFVREAQLLAALEHPRVIPLLGVAWTSSSIDLMIVLPLAEHGDLLAALASSKLEKSKPPVLPFWLRVRLALEVAEALVYLHSLVPALLHRDLKSGNVLLNAEWHALVADFGCARYLRDAEHQGEMDNSTSSRMTESVGTVRWLAPEVLAGEPYGTAVDIFALGQILSELLTSRVPYHAMRSDSDRVIPDHVLATLLVSGELSPPMDVDVDAIAQAEGAPERVVLGRRAVATLMARCTAREPATRPSAVQVAFELRELLAEIEMEEGKEDMEEQAATTMPTRQAALSTASSVALLSSSRSLSPSAAIELVDSALHEELADDALQKEVAEGALHEECKSSDASSKRSIHDSTPRP